MHKMRLQQSNLIWYYTERKAVAIKVFPKNISCFPRRLEDVMKTSSA